MTQMMLAIGARMAEMESSTIGTDVVAYWILEIMMQTIPTPSAMVKGRGELIFWIYSTVYVGTIYSG